VGDSLADGKESRNECRGYQSRRVSRIRGKRTEGGLSMGGCGRRVEERRREEKLGRRRKMASAEGCWSVEGSSHFVVQL
jgi:hypothetical protein